MRIGVILFLIAIHLPVSVELFSISRSMPVRLIQASNNEVVHMIEELYSTSLKDRSKAKKALLRKAKKSIEARNLVVRALIGVLEDSELHDSEVDFGTWYSAAELLGKLRAVEAINTLIKHLDFNDGTVGLSSGHFPALRAVIKIGEAAIPELVKALFESPASIRKTAALALGEIGGYKAKEALEYALTTETDEEVIRYIQIGLNNISKESFITR